MLDPLGTVCSISALCIASKLTFPLALNEVHIILQAAGAALQVRASVAKDCPAFEQARSLYRGSLQSLSHSLQLAVVNRQKIKKFGHLVY